MSLLVIQLDRLAERRQVSKLQCLLLKTVFLRALVPTDELLLRHVELLLDEFVSLAARRTTAWHEIRATLSAVHIDVVCCVPGARSELVDFLDKQVCSDTSFRLVRGTLLGDEKGSVLCNSLHLLLVPGLHQVVRLVVVVLLLQTCAVRSAKFSLTFMSRVAGDLELILAARCGSFAMWVT